MPKKTKEVTYNLQTIMENCAPSRRRIKRHSVRRVDTLQIRKTVTLLLVLLLVVAVFGLMKDFIL